MKKLQHLIMLFAFGGLSANAQIITTVAGNGTAGYNGDNIAATSAEINCVRIAVDASGNIYIADGSNHRIRKVTASTGIITTVAGNGTNGYNGDNILATSAELNDPYDIAFDASGNIYIADDVSFRIRKVTVSTGIITTVAGNGTQGYNGDSISATLAKLNHPNGVALDTSGNIYIADVSNHRIRKVTVSSGIITTVAGNGTFGYNGDNILATLAELANPSGVALDASGNIYVGDVSNNRIRKVTVSTNIITTVAGNGTTGFNGDNIPAISAAVGYPQYVGLDVYGNIYIPTQNFINRIRKVNVSTGIITTVAGNGTTGFNGDNILATQAELNLPEGVAVDASGNIYIADAGNYRIRKVTNTATGIGVLSQNIKEIVIFPNPSTGKFILSNTNSQSRIKSISIFNMIGEEILSQQLAASSQQIEINMAFLPKGMYIIKIQLGEDVCNRKIVVE